MSGQFSDFYNSLDPDPSKRGKQFEHFVKWFLKADPEWAPIWSDNLTLGHANLWGSRGDASKSHPAGKYGWLDENSASTTDWTELQPSSSFYLFVPQNTELRSQYDSYWKLTEMMPLYGAGIITARDHFVVDFEDAPLRRRLEQFRDPRLADDWIRQNMEIKDNSMWSMPEARREFQKKPIVQSSFVDLLYRPFDMRRIYFETNVVFNMRIQVMRHMLASKNLGLVTVRRIPPDKGCSYFYVSRSVIINGAIRMDNQSVDTLFPLHLSEDGKASQAHLGFEGRYNFTANFIGQLAQALKLQVEQQSGLPASMTPEDIFHYTYAVFNSPSYRTRYAEFLKIDFPRLPLIGNMELFRALARLGGELVALHLLESPKVNAFITRFEGKGDNSIPKKPTYKDGAVWINTSQRFEGVPEAVWNFHIGGYQVCQKWLKDRKGRTLSKDDLAHYQKIVIALSETIRLMAEIDQVIEQHGGWPGAFASAWQDANAATSDIASQFD